jgi:hypothetical protein
LHKTLTWFIRRVPLVEQELLTLPVHLSSPQVFSGVRVTESLVLYVCFVDRCLSFNNKTKRPKQYSQNRYFQVFLREENIDMIIKYI